MLGQRPDQLRDHVACSFMRPCCRPATVDFAQPGHAARRIAGPPAPSAGQATPLQVSDNGRGGLRVAECRGPVLVPGVNEVIPQRDEPVEILIRGRATIERAAGEDPPGCLILELDLFPRCHHDAEGGSELVKYRHGGELQTTQGVGVTERGFGKLVDERFGRKRREQDRA